MKHKRAKYKIDDDSIRVENAHIDGCYLSRVGIVKIFDDHYGTSMYFVWSGMTHFRRFKPRVPLEEQDALAESFVRDVVFWKGKK